MDRLICMQTFVRVVETGSFSLVAQELHTSQPTISKQVAALEAHLDAHLLTRSTRGLSLTEAGRRFYEHTKRVLEAIAEAESSVGSRRQPSGSLRVSCPVAFGQFQIVPRLPRFLAQYPEIHLDLQMTHKYVDLVEEGIDVAVRIGELSDSSLVSHCLGMAQRLVVGTPTYFERCGKPMIPEDLIDHNCLTYPCFSSDHEWHFQGSEGCSKVRVNGNFRASSPIAIREAVLANLGITVGSIWLFADVLAQGKAEVVLKNYQLPALPIYAIHTRNRLQPQRLRCFIDFLLKEFRDEPLLHLPPVGIAYQD